MKTERTWKKIRGIRSSKHFAMVEKARSREAEDKRTEVEKNSGAIRGSRGERRKKTRKPGEEECKRVHSRGKCLALLDEFIVVDCVRGGLTRARTPCHTHTHVQALVHVRGYKRECKSIRDTASRGSPPSASPVAALQHDSVTSLHEIRTRTPRT